MVKPQVGAATKLSEVAAVHGLCGAVTWKGRMFRGVDDTVTYAPELHQVEQQIRVCCLAICCLCVVCRSVSDVTQSADYSGSVSCLTHLASSQHVVWQGPSPLQHVQGTIAWSSSGVQLLGFDAGPAQHR